MCIFLHHTVKNWGFYIMLILVRLTLCLYHKFSAFSIFTFSDELWNQSLKF